MFKEIEKIINEKIDLFYDSKIIICEIPSDLIGKNYYQLIDYLKNHYPSWFVVGKWNFFDKKSKLIISMMKKIEHT